MLPKIADLQYWVQLIFNIIPVSVRQVYWAYKYNIYNTEYNIFEKWMIDNLQSLKFYQTKKVANMLNKKMLKFRWQFRNDIMYYDAGAI